MVDSKKDSSPLSSAVAAHAYLPQDFPSWFLPLRAMEMKGGSNEVIIQAVTDDVGVRVVGEENRIAIHRLCSGARGLRSRYCERHRQTKAKQEFSQRDLCDDFC